MEQVDQYLITLLLLEIMTRLELSNNFGVKRERILALEGQKET